MTPTEQAARCLADVPRHADSQGYEPEYILETDALAAIARHLTAGDDLVERATAAMESVTDGPWRVDGEPWNQIVWSGADNRVCFMAHSNGLDDDRDVATARFIAFARQWVPEAAARIAALTVTVVYLEECLKGADARNLDLGKKLQDANGENATLRASLAQVVELTQERDGARKANREMLLEVLAASGQAQEAYEAQLAAEAEAATLRARLARMEGALTKAANRLDWAAGVIKSDKARNQVGEWADEARAALTDGGSNG